MSLDETTHGEDLDWGEVRSACAAKDWRRAWGAVGIDHEGEATPGEIYIFGAARRAWAVAPALRHWRAERDAVYDEHIKQRLRSAQAWREIAPLDKGEMWRRIKRLAGVGSSAKAQHVAALARPGALLAGFKSFKATVGGVELTQFDDASQVKREAFGRLTETLRAGELRIPSSVQDDARAVLDDLLTKGAAERSTVALPSSMRMRWVDHEGSPLEDLRQAMMTLRRPVGATLTMSQDTARALANHPDLRPLTQAGAEKTGLNPHPRGPAQRKRRGR